MMRIEKTKQKDAQLKLPKNTRVPIKTSDDMFTHHCIFLCLGKRGSGKGVLTTNYLRLLKKEGKLDRLIIVSPTAGSNAGLLEQFQVDSDDILDPEDPLVVEILMEKINRERDQYVEELKKLKDFNEFEKLYFSNMPIQDIDPLLLMEHCDTGGNLMKPTLKYGHRPNIHVLVDDCQSTALFRNKRFHNLCIRHRHLGEMPYDKKDPEMCGAIGCSLYILIQNLKAQGGGSCPRPIRNNATQFAIVGKIKDIKELDDIYTSMAGEVSKEQFYKAYEYATQERYNSFIIDLNPKDPNKKFRKNLDEYLIMEEKQD